MMKKLFLAILCATLSIGLSVAQTRTVTGIVTSAEDGAPIIGASILVKGTTIGTTTDYDGKFSLDAGTNARTLVVSYIGMETQEVAVQSNMRIVLRTSTIMVEELVVTAMGITKATKALGYAHQELKADELLSGANSSLSGALQGKTSGLEIKPSSGMPGASSQIVIRGARSFTGNNTPLYVIDGMPVASTPDISTGGSVSGTDYANRGVDINPSDIESINILKGQAAAALYGIRASNGVIIITTRSGKGLAKGKPQVSYTTNVSMDNISRVPEVQQKYAQGSKSRFAPSASTSWGPLITELPNDPTYGGNANGHPGMYRVPQRENAGLDPWVTPQVYDNIGNFFETGVTFNNTFNVSQALEKTTYSISLGTTNQTGIVPNTGMDRYSGKIGAETKLHEHWKSGFVGNFINSSINKQTAANGGLVATVYPAPASYDLMGIPANYKDNPYQQNAYRSTGGFDNAPWSIENNEFTEKTDRFFGNVYAEYSTKLNTTNQKLNVKYQMGVDSYATHYQNIYGYGHFNGTGEIFNEGFQATIFNSLLTANYDFQINEDMNLNAVLGNEINQNNNDFYSQYGAQYNFPGWNHINNVKVKDLSEETYQRREVGFFGNVSFSYKNMLYLSATGRQDYVSTMPRDNRSFFYPSVSLGFILSELEGIKGNSIVNFAKIRASYAEVGQAGTYRANYYATPIYGSGFWGGTPIVYPLNGVNAFTPYSTVYDPDLKPQNTRSYELGFDVSFADNLVTLNYTYSRQDVKNQIFGVPLAGSTGYSSLMTNGGAIHTNAHEISLAINPIRTKNIDWSLGFNWSKIDNYVDELAPGVNNIFLGGFVDPQVRANIGDKFPVLYGVTYLRDKETGNILVDDDGLPMAGAEGVLGTVSPDFILGANTSLRLWDLSLSAVFEWKNGGQMYGGTSNLMNMYGMGKDTEDRNERVIVFDGWKEDGTKNDIEIKGANAHQDYYSAINGISEGSIYGSSFVKLREIALSYPVLKKSWMTVDLSVFARNILLWTEFPYLDPESSQGNTNMAGGFERFSLPQTTSYGMGLNVKF